MRFTVTWRPDAEEKLAQVWMQSNARRSVQAAADAIEFLLKDDPQLLGKPFFGDFIFGVPPVAVVYQIFPDDRIVQIWDMWERPE